MFHVKQSKRCENKRKESFEGENPNRLSFLLKIGEKRPRRGEVLEKIAQNGSKTANIIDTRV